MQYQDPDYQFGWNLAKLLFEAGQSASAANFARKKSSRSRAKPTGRAYTRGAGKKRPKGKAGKSSDLKTKKSCSKGIACGRSCIAATKTCGSTTLKNTVRAASEYLRRGTTTSGKKLSKADQRRIQELSDDAQRQLDEREADKKPKSKSKPARDAVMFRPGPLSISEFREFASALYEGKATPEGVLKNWENYRDGGREGIRAELSKETIKSLRSKYQSAAMAYGDTKKAQLVEGVLHDFDATFSPGAAIAIGYAGSKTADQAWVAAIDKVAHTWTQDFIDKQAAEIADRRKKRQEQLESRKKALENPETWAEYKAAISARGFDSLSPAQKRKADELLAAESRSRRRQQKEGDAKLDRQTGKQHISSSTLPSGVQVDVKKAWHAKKQHDLYVASLSDRVDRDTYNDLNARAKALGGYYSAYSKNGAIPGFQFRDQESAQKFAEMGATTKETTAPTPSTKRTAADRLREQADRIERRGQESLNQDRLANTARRARQAARAENAAQKDIQKAQIMRAIADSVEQGNAQYLDRVSSGTEIDLLRSSLFQAQVKTAAKIRRNTDEYNAYRKHMDKPAGEEDIENARYPYPMVAQTLINHIKEKALPRNARKAADLLEKEYQSRRAQGGEEWQSISDPKEIEALRTVAPHMESIYGDRLGLADYDRAQRLDLKTEAEFRQALREFLPVMQSASLPPKDEIKEAERALIGRKIPGYFPTPPAVVDRLMDQAGIRPGHRVLEPSAGKGNIADRINSVLGGEGQLDTIEVNTDLHRILEAKGLQPHQEDFMQFQGRQYDRIVMNPPFENGQDIDHVRHAYDLLAPGGRIAAVMSEGPFFRSDKQATAFREWLEQNNGYSEALPDGSFRSSERPTGVATRMVVIEKPNE